MHRGPMRLPGRTGPVRWRMRRHVEQCNQLRHVWDRVRLRASVQFGNVHDDVRHGTGHVRWCLRGHPERCEQLRFMRCPVHRGADLRDGGMRLSGGHAIVRGKLRRCFDGSYELWRVRHGVRRGRSVQCRNVHDDVRDRTDELLRPVCRPPE